MTVHIGSYQLQPTTPSSPEEQTSASVTSGTKSPRSHPWTLTHAFYALMGGYVVDTTGATSSPSDKGRLVLTARGVIWLMQHAPALLPDLSEDAINDRSKADTVAKVLLMSHVLYFCISCAGRLARSLPLSLLEIVTLAHAVSTVITYVAWWKKPLNIMEPTVISGTSDEFREAVGFLLKHTPREVLHPRKRRPRRSKLYYYQRLTGEISTPPPPRPMNFHIEANAGDSIAAFQEYPFLDREPSLGMTAFSDRYNSMQLGVWRSAALCTCTVLYALPLFLGWNVEDENIRSLWRGIAVGLLVTGAIQAADFWGVPVAYHRDSALSFCAVWLVSAVLTCGILGYFVLGFLMALVSLLQLLVLPPDVYKQTRLFQFGPHFT